MTKTICLSFISLLLIFSVAYGQKRNGYKPDWKSVVINFAWITPPDRTIPFSKIEVIDCRLDTSKLGYMDMLKEMDAYRKLITGQSLASLLQSSLNAACKDQLDTSVNRTLVIVIKNLWLHETTNAELKHQNIAGEHDQANRKFGMCRSVLETYALENSTYTPLFRADTSFPFKRTYYDERSLIKDAASLMSLPFTHVMDKAASIGIHKLTGSRKNLKWNDIKNYNDKRLDYPRFANDTAARGVYLTFKDFLNNKPLVKEFSVDAGKVTDELYITENGEETLINNCWGFSDGAKNYVRIGFNFFELARQMNTYELLGTKTLISKDVRASVGIGSFPVVGLLIGITGDAIHSSAKSAKTGNYRPMQVNMETGEVY